MVRQQQPRVRKLSGEAVSILRSGCKGRQKNNLLRLEIGHLVQCLWYKHEDMNVWPENTCKKLGTVTHACNLATGKAETG